MALKKQSSTGQTTQGGLKRTLSDQPVVDTATATEQAKMLIKSGAISAIKAENKNSGFKRSRTLEGKLKDPEKGPTPTFQPFQRSVSADSDSTESSKRTQRKMLYESFVSSGDRTREPEKESGGSPSWEATDRDKEADRDRDRERERDRERDRDRDRDRDSIGGFRNHDRDWERDRDRGRRERDRDRERDRERDRDQDRDRERDQPFRRSDSFPDRRPPRKGNTLYVHGTGMSEESLRSAFSAHGNIIDLSMDSPRNCAFITFEKMESADQAVAELNGTVVGDVNVRVSIARKQPMLEAATGKSLWGSLGMIYSAKGSHRDKDTRLCTLMISEIFLFFGKYFECSVAILTELFHSPLICLHHNLLAFYICKVLCVKLKKYFFTSRTMC
ncbi:negative elongation factor E isoform X2 [Erpetoichthys calabaricus]|nr:negative elongation factor E isoform X2 [Erpetoichthys calabaricus]